MSNESQTNGAEGIPKTGILCQPLLVSDCIPGFYCPNVNSSNPQTYPVQCLPSPACQRKRLLGNQCPSINERWKAQSPFEPMICPPGYYCSTPRSIKICPENHFCPTGTIKPRPCDSFSFCSKGSTFQKVYTGIIAAFVLDVILITICLFQYRIDRHRRRDSAEIHSSKSTKPNETISSDLIKNALAGTFRKAMDGKNLRMDFRMENLGYTLPNGKSILEGVSGEIVSGKMTAIMGPSGAGKTTFMNVLCGKVNRTSGSLYISESQSEMTLFKKICGFVPQEDIMYNELSVKENILHSARLRLPSSWSRNDIEKHVNNVLKALNLFHVGDVVSGSISGGQRKRTNIAMELAAAPICLCLDEPTSGLDSTAALEVTDLLSKIASLGMTIVAVIHQPRLEIFRKFDHVLMIVPGGRTAYFGAAIQARFYFEKLGFDFSIGGNEADTLMDILSGNGNYKDGKQYTIDHLVQWWDEWKSPSNCAEMGAINESNNSMRKSSFHDLAKKLVQERGASFLKQMWHSTWLSILQQYRTISGLILEIFVGTSAGMLMGFAMRNQKEVYQGMWKEPFSILSPAPMFTSVGQFTMLIGISIALSAAPAGTKVFSEELSVYRRAASSGVSPLAYFLAKTLGSFPRILLAATHFSGVLYYLTSPVIPFWIVFIIILLFFYAVYGLSAFVSMIVKRENATLLSVIFGLFSSIFCGYSPTLVEAKDYNMLYVWKASYTMYATEAFFSETLAVYDHVYENSYANNVFGFTLNQTIYDLSMMVFIGTFWRLIAFIAMKLFHRENQR